MAFNFLTELNKGCNSYTGMFDAQNISI